MISSKRKAVSEEPDQKEHAGMSRWRSLETCE